MLGANALLAAYSRSADAGIAMAMVQAMASLGASTEGTTTQLTPSPEPATEQKAAAGDPSAVEAPL